MSNASSEEIIVKIKQVISQFTDIEMEDIRLESKLVSDLGFTSFDMVSLLSALETEFGVKGNENMLKDIKSVKDVSEVILNAKQG